MKWKTLGNAVLVTSGLFALITLIIVVGEYFPWLLIAIAFVALTFVIYNAILKYDSTDNDRMAWFSNDEEDNEDDEMD